ncbi:hypothetical protein P7C70_g8992, partial [Phenoliferia sp. Uapishka_3]
MDAEFALLESKKPLAGHPLKDVLYGSVRQSPISKSTLSTSHTLTQAAGIVSKLVEHPLDLVKVRLQSQPLDRPFKYTGPLDCFFQTLKSEGLKGLWRGVSMPIGGAMAENATLFLVYNNTQNLLRHLSPPNPSSSFDNTTTAPLPIGQLAISAALAGACASFVLTPVELVKCKMQVQAITSLSPSASSSPSSHPQPQLRAPGPLSITLQILHREGPRGLWLGQTGTIIRETGGSAAWFTTFELLASYFISRRLSAGQLNSSGERRLEKGDLAAWELMMSGAAAGVAYNCVLFPADCIKSTIQTEDELRGLGKGGGGERRTFLKVGKDIYAARGIKGLYQGCGITALRAAPSSALIFYIYSRLESIFG